MTLRSASRSSRRSGSGAMALAWDGEHDRVVIEAAALPEDGEVVAGRHRRGSRRPGPRPDPDRRADRPGVRRARDPGRGRGPTALPALRRAARSPGPHLRPTERLPELGVDPLPLLREGELEVRGRLTVSSNAALVGIVAPRDPGRRARPPARRPRRPARPTPRRRGPPARTRPSRRSSTSRSRSSGRCGTSPTGRSPTARWRPTWSPRRPAGRSSRRRSCATARPARGWSSCGSTRTRRSTPGSSSRRTTRGSGRWPCSTRSSTTPIARAATSCRSARTARSTCTASTTASASRVDPKLRTVLWAWRGTPIAPDRARRPRPAPGGARRRRSAAALGELLDPDEVAATRARLDDAARLGPLPRAVARLAGRPVAAVLTGTNGSRAVVRRGSVRSPASWEGGRHAGEWDMPIRFEAYTSEGVRRGIATGDARLGDLIELERELQVTQGHLAPLDGSAPDRRPVGRRHVATDDLFVVVAPADTPVIVHPAWHDVLPRLRTVPRHRADADDARASTRPARSPGRPARSSSSTTSSCRSPRSPTAARSSTAWPGSTATSSSGSRATSSSGSSSPAPSRSSSRTRTRRRRGRPGHDGTRRQAAARAEPAEPSPAEPSRPSPAPADALRPAAGSR